MSVQKLAGDLDVKGTMIKPIVTAQLIALWLDPDEAWKASLLMCLATRPPATIGDQSMAGCQPVAAEFIDRQ